MSLVALKEKKEKEKKTLQAQTHQNRAVWGIKEEMFF